MTISGRFGNFLGGVLTMSRNSNRVCVLLAAALGLLVVAPARAASLQSVTTSAWSGGDVPTYISMYIYVPDTPAANPPILVVSHFCGGSASQVFSQAQTGGIVSAADKYGFIMIFPQTTNPATSAKCWDVGSTKSLTHDGGGDTQAIAEMVKYTVTKYSANSNRVYATGDSSGGMMTEALLAVYPDIFKAGSSFAGVPAGCWSLGWTAASNWGGTCAGSGTPAVSSVNETAVQWGDKVRAMDPGYSGHRPRAQLFHGDQDQYVAYTNLREGIKEWTNVLSLSTDPTSTDTGLTLGTHQATRQRWQDSCGYVVLEAITSIGGDHGPSDALFNSSYVIPFLGLDKTDAIDPGVAACGDAGVAGGTGGASGTGGNAGSGGAGGNKDGGATGGAAGNKDAGNVNVPGSGGVVGSGGAIGSGGVVGSGGSASSGGTSGKGGATGTGGTSSSGGNSGGAGSGGGGGTSGSGGISSSGGTTGSGGSSANGGSSGSGGSSVGSSGSGGSSGSSSSGGRSGSSSSTAAGGTTSSGCSCAVGRTTGSGKGLALFLVSALGLALRRRRRTVF
jgi:poly(hydroxyalkanoate) depolymerase family esterase